MPIKNDMTKLQFMLTLQEELEKLNSEFYHWAGITQSLTLRLSNGAHMHKVQNLPYPA